MSVNRYFAHLAQKTANYPFAIVAFTLTTMPKGGVMVMIADDLGRSGSAGSVSPENAIELAFSRMCSSKRAFEKGQS